MDFTSKSMLEHDRACAEEAWLLEAEFTEFLSWAQEYSVYEEGGLSRLEMRSARGKTLVFEPLPPAVENIVDVVWSLRMFVRVREDECGTLARLGVGGNGSYNDGQRDRHLGDIWVQYL